MRHRGSLQDAAFVLGVILLVGLAAFEFSFTGAIQEDKRIDFEEMLVLGALVVVSILYLGWRRVRDQEREIRRRIMAERRAHELAHTDPLTGLANRRQFEGTLSAATALPCSPHEVHALLMLDLNGFKKVNDIYGHGEGDELLVAIAKRLRDAVRERDVIARLGGDEFAVLSHHLAGPEAAAGLALRLLKEFEEPIRVGTRAHKIGSGIGVALIPRDGEIPGDILRKADVALYRAKGSGESSVRFFEEDMDQRLRERDTLERELRAAIGTAALRPWYQPIVDLKTDKIAGFEALARWSHPDFGDIPPERFIPIAEGCGLIRDVSNWLLTCAARDACAWPEHVMLSFNISPVELKDPTVSLRVLRIIAAAGLPPRRLEVEITESAIVHDLEAAKSVLSTLREAGVSIAVDDFGTGYSSLYHLRTFKLDKIKIDRSFVHAMQSEAESAAIVRALTGLGNGLGVTLVAEGIEAGDERVSLLQQGCQQGQGFLFSQALPADQALALFSRDGIGGA